MSSGTDDAGRFGPFTQDEYKEMLKSDRRVACPDCGATLEVVSQSHVPEDVRVSFVKHGS